MRGIGDQPDRRAEHQRQRALAADQRPGHVEAALGQQVLQRVAGDLPAEPAELGADRRELAVHQPPEVVEGARRRCAVQAQPLPAAGDDVEADDVVRGPAVAQGAGAAGVVADHPADGAAVVGARVGSEAQAARLHGPLQRRLHDARLDRRRPGLDVDVEHPRQVPAGVDDHAGPDGVAGDRGARAAHGQRARRGRGRPPARRRSRRRAAAGRPPGAGRGRASASEEYSARASPESSTSARPAPRRAASRSASVTTGAGTAGRCPRCRPR